MIDKYYKVKISKDSTIDIINRFKRFDLLQFILFENRQALEYPIVLQTSTELLR